MLEISARRFRLDRAADFADLYCGKTIGLEEMAAKASLSKYHFVRAFSEQYLETPGAFLQRLRLERAAQRLVYQRWVPITEIALGCGFSSPQCFSRAFRTRFGAAPRDFRAENVYRFESYWRHHASRESVNPVLRIRPDRRPSYRTAYLRRIGNYEDCGDCSRYYRHILDWARDAGLDLDCTPILGVYWDNPSVTSPALCRYDICVPIPDDFETDDSVGVQVVPGGLFAVARLESSPSSLRDVWELFHLQLPHFTGGSRRCYEFYHPKTWNGDPCFVCADFCVPIEDNARLSLEQARSLIANRA